MTSKGSRDLRQQAGQLLIMGFAAAEPTAKLRTTLSLLQPSGVILFARNIESAAQTHALLAACRKSVAAPLFTCVDLEGGLVDRLRAVVAPAPSVADVFVSGDPRLYRAHGELLGRESRALGFNVDFAPVFDLALAESKGVMKTRTASAAPQKVTAYARAFLAGLREAGVLGCGKHFPGLGAANLDTHFELPSVPRTWKQMWEEDLLPYRKLRGQMPFVMVAHANYPHITGDDLPASLSSRWMRDILRRRIGYKGIVLSDDLEMGGVLAAAPIGHAAVETLRAGADMFLVCQTEENVQAAWEAVVREAERDGAFARLIGRAAARVLRFKARAREMRAAAPKPSAAAVERLRRQVAAFTKAVERAGRTA